MSTLIIESSGVSLAIDNNVDAESPGVSLAIDDDVNVEESSEATLAVGPHG
jgi:hypothetical protein